MQDELATICDVMAASMSKKLFNGELPANVNTIPLLHGFLQSCLFENRSNSIKAKKAFISLPQRPCGDVTVSPSPDLGQSGQKEPSSESGELSWDF